MENVTKAVNTISSVITDSMFVRTLSTDISSHIYESATRTLEKGTHTTLTRQLEESTTIPGKSDENGYSDIYFFSYDYTDEYMYPGYSFERPVYLYIWEILVVYVFLVNVVVIRIFLRREMRNATNMILATIAISDSLTGLVTLPSYIMVYQSLDPVPEYQGFDLNQTYSYDFDYYESGFGNDTAGKPLKYDDPSPHEGYKFTKSLCRGFMISKYFLSSSFHTMSIFLTLLLGIQRYVSVAFPFKSRKLFSKVKTIILCAIIFVVSPAFHSYHLGNENAINGVCKWELAEFGCKGGCMYLWFIFFLRHLIPCMALLIFTGLFIRQLRSDERKFRRMVSNESQLSKRIKQNRRISIVVTAIVIVFLVPEIPYSFFLLYNAILKTANNGQNIKLETNRAIHMSYEVLLVCSFHANFYIYTFFNRKFRKCMYRTFIKPVQRYVGD